MIWCILVLMSMIGCFAQLNFTLPLPIDTNVLLSGTCPSTSNFEASRQSSIQDVRNLLRAKVIPSIKSRVLCNCQGPGWTRIAHFDIQNSSHQCPSTWNLITTPVRGCGRVSSNFCVSTTLQTRGQSYFRVCGRIAAYQKGKTDAFSASASGTHGLDGPYLAGISLTHGVVGSRQHIWSFTSALHEFNPSYSTINNCPCTRTDVTGRFHIPSFVGDHYFCDTGNSGPGYDVNRVYSSNPLWDGAGCGPTNACCTFNNPPWFCRTLPQPTTDDIEMRNCAAVYPRTDEDIIVTYYDIYIM